METTELKMEKIRIASVNDPLFVKVWDIYTESFPFIEQRTMDHQITAMKSNSYHLDCYMEDDKLIGFFGLWEFDDHIYIEHFAIDPTLRSGGWGSKILSALQQSSPKTIILEIDEVGDEISTRRETFYKRLGFVSNPYTHPLPVYQTNNHADAMLQIMTYPEAIDRETYDRFDQNLRKVVMFREQ